MTWRPVRQNTLSDKILEENLGRIIVDINHSNIFLDLSPKITETKAKINKWDLIKHKSFVPQKKPLKKNTEKTTYGIEENICKWYKY